jgi:hypothetical protein
VRRIACTVGIVVGLLVTGAARAQASWPAPGDLHASSTATSLNRPSAPVVTRVGAGVNVTWTVATLGEGPAATDYTVLRKVGAVTTTVCTTTAPTVTCNDTSPVFTTADYSVIARYKVWSSQESVRTSFLFDTTAPVTTAAVAGTPNATGWVRAASSNVTLTASDANSGVASIKYKVGAADAVTVDAATASFEVKAQGSTTITYAATDNAGNVEADQILTVKLDNVAPTAAMTFPTTGGPFTSGQWGTNCRTSANAAVSGICGTTVDTASGTESVQYELSRVRNSVGNLKITQCWNGHAFSQGACGTYRDTADGPTAGSWMVPLSYTSLDDGEYELRLQATDVAGNAMPTTLVATWTH